MGFATLRNVMTGKACAKSKTKKKHLSSIVFLPL